MLYLSIAIPPYPLHITERERDRQRERRTRQLPLGYLNVVTTPTAESEKRPSQVLYEPQISVYSKSRNQIDPA